MMTCLPVHRAAAGILRTTCALLILLVMAALPRIASAACSIDRGSSWAPVNYSPPTSIYVPANAPIGTVLWNSGQVAPQSAPSVTCNGTTSGGIKNYISTQPTSGATVFPTGIAGLGCRLAHGNDTSFMVANPADSIASGGYSFSVTTGLQLVVTGPIANGVVLAAGQLGSWSFTGADPIQVFITKNNVTFKGPACTAVVDPTVVTLPTVFTGSFSGRGTTAGATTFALQLSCQAGVQLSVQLDTSNAVAGTTGVIAATGGATGVGVQVTDTSGNPIVFGTPYSKGITPSGPMSVPFSARYYQTTTALPGSGKVNATATYTLTYQ